MPKISMNGNTKIKTLQKVFSNRFPHLKLSIYESSSKSPIDENLTLSDAGKNGDVEFMLRGAQKVKNFISSLSDDFGLYCEVAKISTSDQPTVAEGTDLEMKLSDFNKNEKVSISEKEELLRIYNDPNINENEWADLESVIYGWLENDEDFIASLNLDDESLNDVCGTILECFERYPDKHKFIEMMKDNLW